MNAQVLIKQLMGVGLSQAEIARRSGISQPTISRIHAGIHVDIRVRTLQALELLALSVEQRGVEPGLGISRD